MGRLFDAYVMVDWSAASKPTTGANSIWVGVLARDARLKMAYSAVNPSTRLKAVEFIEGIVGKLTGRGDKVLIGFDFSFGYPAGTADALGLDTSNEPPWAAMHALLAGKLKDKPDNSNSRFAVAAGFNYRISKGPFPFWGVPARDEVSTLATKKGDFAANGLPEYRAVEAYARAEKKAQPKSVWQLAYTGSVGSQMLLGIPHVRTLRGSLPDARIWPFETGFRALDETALDGVQVVLAEIYPSMVTAEPEGGEPPDAAQVRTIARHYWGLDEKERLGAAFGPPQDWAEAKIPQIEREEGWILGV
ncbi:MAG: hypothetical protein AAFX03_03660 [Pseudomonadota bacterium]